MPRYFLEVAYQGTRYSGFQVQRNANSIQGEIESALQVLGKKIALTGSSRTDAGVHALQNFFHFDSEEVLAIDNRTLIYKLNAILPGDIVVEHLIPVAAAAHCRFDAVSREYKYFIYGHKDPFLRERAFYFPYKLDFDLMRKIAHEVQQYSDFSSFSKKKTQARTFECKIHHSAWEREGRCFVYHVTANRFLRGMVRGLVATMLLAGRGKLTFDQFKQIIEAKDRARANFAAPAYGLFLISVKFPAGYFEAAT